MSHVEELHELVADLEGADTQQDAIFAALVDKGLQLTNISDADFAESVNASRPTVTRWRNRQSVPHPMMRPAIYRALRKEVEKEIERTK